MHKIYLYVTSDGVMGIIINRKCGDAVIRRLYVVQFHISLDKFLRCISRQL